MDQSVAKTPETTSSCSPEAAAAVPVTDEQNDPVASATSDSGRPSGHDVLLQNLKREVKCIMEESAIRRCVYIESNYVAALCASVEACLSDGLKRRVLGLFGTTTYALLHKISKLCPPAAAILKMVVQIQQQAVKQPDRSPEKKLRNSIATPTLINSRYLWIKIALIERELAIIVDFVCRHAHRYYDQNAFMLHPLYGSMTSSLLAGPCALEFSRIKTSDSYFNDPPANELVQRHRIHASMTLSSVTSPVSTESGVQSPYRKPLQVQRNPSIGSGLDELGTLTSAPAAGREYVRLLHQNNRSSLLYGKNNVTVCPVGSLKPMKGYLSLHHNASGNLMVKWTPNELMHSESQPTPNISPIRRMQQSSHLWQNSLNVNMLDIVYLHYHHQHRNEESSNTESANDVDGGSVVLVGADGIQYPPIVFPTGQHPIQFLSCLENALLPWNQLDPPLWVQKGKGKILPLLKRRTSGAAFPSTERLFESATDTICEADETSVNMMELYDLVFRIVPVMRMDATDRNGAHTDMTQQSSTENNNNNDDASESEPTAGQGDRRLVSLASLSRMVRNQFSRVSGGSDTSSSTSGTPLGHKDQSAADRCGSESGTDDDSGLDMDSVVPISVLTLSDEHNNSYAQLIKDPVSSQNHSDCATPSDSRSALNIERTMSTPTPQFGDGGVAAGMTPRLDNVNETDIGGTPVGLVASACHSMRRQILSRAFCGWLAYCRHLKTIRTHLSCLVRQPPVCFTDVESGLTNELWEKLRESKNDPTSELTVHRAVYAGGIVDPNLRPTVWPYLLGFVPWHETLADVYSAAKINYETILAEWGTVEVIVRQMDHEQSYAAYTREWLERSNISADDSSAEPGCSLDNQANEDDVVMSPVLDQHQISPSGSQQSTSLRADQSASIQGSPIKGASPAPPPDSGLPNGQTLEVPTLVKQGSLETEYGTDLCSKDLTHTFALNLHRIEKDVHRCDRSYAYFSKTENLDKLKNVMCTYVWEHLDSGYVQGMCDLAAPLLVVFDDEVTTFGCFCKLMERMNLYFPNNSGMDLQLANMRALIQVVDPEVYDLMHRNGDYTHFYFAYRWFLLDFKRELAYVDVFHVWEVIWSARHVASSEFVLFIALALITIYRDIILDNAMDFTDIIKFFNEMAEKHDSRLALRIARNQVRILQGLVESSARPQQVDSGSKP